MFFLGKRNITYTSSRVRAMLNSSESNHDESDSDPTFMILAEATAGSNRDNHGEQVGKDEHSKTLLNKILSITKYILHILVLGPLWGQSPPPPPPRTPTLRPFPHYNYQPGTTTTRERVDVRRLVI